MYVALGVHFVYYVQCMRVIMQNGRVEWCLSKHRRDFEVCCIPVLLYYIKENGRMTLPLFSNNPVMHVALGELVKLDWILNNF